MTVIYFTHRSAIWVAHEMPPCLCSMLHQLRPDRARGRTCRWLTSRTGRLLLTVSWASVSLLPIACDCAVRACVPREYGRNAWHFYGLALEAITHFFWLPCVWGESHAGPSSFKSRERDSTSWWSFRRACDRRYCCGHLWKIQSVCCCITKARTVPLAGRAL